MTAPLVHSVTGALMERFPMLDPQKAGEMAQIAVDVLAEPVRISATLDVCRVCRSPQREDEA